MMAIADKAIIRAFFFIQFFKMLNNKAVQNYAKVFTFT